MKKILLAAFIFSGLMIQKADAQVRVGVNINVGAQPDWGPYGYDNAQYYYFPDMDMYYDLAGQQFVYFDGYQWVFSPYLPQAYAGFDLYHAYKVVINEPRPYLRADYYRKQYYSYRGYHNQPVLRDYRNNMNYGRMDQRFDRDDRRGLEDRGRQMDNRGGFDHRESRGFGRDDRGGRRH